jgi:hypothetical protein
VQCTELLYLWYLYHFSKVTNWFAGVVRTVIAAVKWIYLEDIDLYFVNRDFYSMQPLISAVTLKKEKASVARPEAVPRMLQAASLGLPCREMCDAITHTCGCDKPTTFGQVTCIPPLPTLAPFLFQVPQLFCVNNLQK